MPPPSQFVDDDRFDGLYMNVADAARGIEPLLDTVFSFLRRKTDFFAGPPGSANGTEDAIRKVNEVLQKHAQLYEQEHSQKKKSHAAKKKTTTTPSSSSKKAKKEQDDDDVIEMGNDGQFDATSSPPAATKKETKKKVPPPTAAKIDKTKTISETTKDAKKEFQKIKEEAQTNKDGDDKAAPSRGNGGTVEGKYVWTQILSELSVTVPLPDNTRGRDLNVTIARKHLKVGLKNTAAAGTQWIVDADLIKPIIVDDSFWTVEDGNRLVINLQKANGMEWWDAICVGDPKINVQKIQPENSNLSDLDGDTRKTVEKMMFDQRQKAMGLPTSDEQQKFDMLEKFKKAHPEMDFSQAKIS